MLFWKELKKDYHGSFQGDRRKTRKTENTKKQKSFVSSQFAAFALKRGASKLSKCSKKR